MKNFFIIFLFLFACSNSDKSDPLSPLIPEDIMIEMIVDLALCDAVVDNEKLETNKLIYQKRLSLYEGVFEKHQFTADEYEEAYKIYSEDLIHLNEMYDKALEELSKREVELKP